MVLSYMEEIISKFYKKMGYTVSHHVIYKVPKAVPEALKDIDILAISKKEAIIIGCRPYTGHVEGTDMTKAIIQDFNFSEQSIKDIPMIMNKKIIKTLVIEEPIKKVDTELEKNGIKVYTLQDLMMDFLILLLKRHMGKRLESRANDMIRNLIYSIIEEKV